MHTVWYGVTITHQGSWNRGLPHLNLHCTTMYLFYYAAQDLCSTTTTTRLLHDAQNHKLHDRISYKAAALMPFKWPSASPISSSRFLLESDWMALTKSLVDTRPWRAQEPRQRWAWIADSDSRFRVKCKMCRPWEKTCSTIVNVARAS